MKISAFIYCIILLSILGSCGNSSKKNTVLVDGSSTVYPLSEAVAEEFSKAEPEICVIVNYSGTGSGFKNFFAQNCDINNASRPIKPKEINQSKATQTDYLELKVAYDGLAIVINKENTWVNELSVEDLRKIWEPGAKGKINKWSDIHKNWPDEKIKLYGPGPASGTFDFFTEKIMNKAGSCRNDYSPNEDDHVLVHGISQNKYALGYFGYAYFEENKDKLKLVPVNNGKATVLPSPETVTNGTYSPLTRPLYIYVNKNSCSKKVVREFVRYYLNNAGPLASEVGYMALKEQQYTKEMQRFEQFLQ